jgi:hypothetical protein
MPKTPEDAYRQLFLALLEGDEHSIRKLTIDNPDADVLWKDGAYPPQMAAQLAEQYRTMEISVADGSVPERVVLNSSAFPLPLTVVKVDGTWKVDAEPIIKGRQTAEQIRADQSPATPP